MLAISREKWNREMELENQILPYYLKVVKFFEKNNFHSADGSFYRLLPYYPKNTQFEGKLKIQDGLWNYYLIT